MLALRDSMAFFKSADELVDKGNDFIKQREFQKALDVYQKAIVKYQKDNDVPNAALSNAMASILGLHNRENNPQAYYRAAEALKLMGDQEIKVGLKNVRCSALANECMIAVEEMSARSIPIKKENLLERGQKLYEVGKRYQAIIGPNSLFIPELYWGASINGITKAFGLFAESQENFAEHTVWSDPKKAAEYYQTAASYRKQLGDARMEQADSMKIKQYSKAVTCWICGREITGEMVHFYPMPSDISPVQRNCKPLSPLPSSNEAQGAVYACRACHSAISNRADEIAEHYHKLAVQEIQRVELQLRAEIRELHNRINTIR